jgi:hypothetical protein
MRDTVIAFIIIISFGLIVPISLRIIGWGWTLLLLGITAASVLLSIAAVRMREDRELEEQIEQVLKPAVSILPEPDESEEQEREPVQPASTLEDSSPIEAEEGSEPLSEHWETGTGNGGGDGNHVEAEEAAQQTLTEPEPTASGLFPGEAADTVETVPSFSLTDLERVQQLYDSATQALRRRDFFTAYKQLKQALTCHPPVTAKWMITWDMVSILKEMGLYRECIEELEKLILELPDSAEKKRSELKQHIAFLQILSRVLETESKQNLSWSQIPAHIRSRADQEYREYIATTAFEQPFVTT